MGYVCTYKYNRAGAWGWTPAHSKPFCLLLTQSLTTFSFYAWAWFRVRGLDTDAAFQEEGA